MHIHIFAAEGSKRAAGAEHGHVVLISAAIAAQCGRYMRPHSVDLLLYSPMHSSLPSTHHLHHG